MKMYQIAAFQFMSVVSKGNDKYVRQGLAKLSLTADKLGDDAFAQLCYWPSEVSNIS